MAELSENERVREQLLREEKAERDKLNAQNYGYRQGLAAGFIDGHEKGFTDGHEKGYSVGHEKGYSVGHEKGLAALSRLIQLLIANDRQNEIARATSDMEYQKKLLAEFHLL